MNKVRSSALQQREKSEPTPSVRLCQYTRDTSPAVVATYSPAEHVREGNSRGVRRPCKCQRSALSHFDRLEPPIQRRSAAVTGLSGAMHQGQWPTACARNSCSSSSL